MRDDRPSFTAWTVAAMRGMGSIFPPDERLVDDPYGLVFGGPVARALLRARPVLRASLRLGGPLAHLAIWMQLRTRAIDDAIARFVDEGGRQVVLLGAGFDARATRLRDALRGATVFEVDHPATQRRKRALLAENGLDAGVARYLAWDFEKDAMAELPSRLETIGLRTDRATLTVWEGVTMYLTEPAVEASVAAIHGFGAKGSILAMTYFDRAALHRPTLAMRVGRAIVARVGEPYRWGWDPPKLPGWLAERGFSLESDESALALAAHWMPSFRGALGREGRGHVAIARRTGEVG